MSHSIHITSDEDEDYTILRHTIVGMQYGEATEISPAVCSVYYLDITSTLSLDYQGVYPVCLRVTGRKADLLKQAVEGDVLDIDALLEKEAPQC